MFTAHTLPASAATEGTVPTTAIPVRKPKLSFEEPIPVLWFGGNAFLTFLFDGFNLTFPEGERFFVRAVHDHAAEIQDSTLQAQIRGFSGQEGFHAKVHEELFAALEAQGFDLAPFFARHDAYMRNVRKRPAALRLAVTAALEHYTAVMARVLFETDLLEGVHPTMRKLLVWHATEELEHCAVAFDVLRATRPGYGLRALGFLIGSISVLAWITIGMRTFIKQSGVPRAQLWADFRNTRIRTKKARLFRSLLTYLKPGFHPHQRGGLANAHRHLAAEGLL